MSAMIEYNPLDPRVLENPYPTYAALREASPILWHAGMQSWVLTRYRDCQRVLRDHTTFGRDWRRVGEPVPDVNLSVQSLDPPAQSPLRSLFLRATQRRTLDRLVSRARDRFEGLFWRMDTGERFDFVEDIASPVSLSVICELLGVVEPEPAYFSAVSNAIMESMDSGLVPERAGPGRRARGELTALVGSWFHAGGRPGLLADVLSAEPPGELDEIYLRNTMRVMFQGGYSTMMAALCNAQLTLLRHPEVIEGLTSSAVLDSGVEELVRFDGPVQGTSRVTTTTCRIGDTTVRRGEVVLCLLAAANRDPEQFIEPDRIVLDRSPNHHMGYGWGPHACIGTAPAQVALQALVHTLADHPRHLHLTGHPARRNTATMRTCAAIPVVFLGGPPALPSVRVRF